MIDAAFSSVVYTKSALFRKSPMKTARHKSMFIPRDWRNLSCYHSKALTTILCGSLLLKLLYKNAMISFQQQTSLTVTAKFQDTFIASLTVLTYSTTFVVPFGTFIVVKIAATQGITCKIVSTTPVIWKITSMETTITQLTKSLLQG